MLVIYHDLLSKYHKRVLANVVVVKASVDTMTWDPLGVGNLPSGERCAAGRIRALTAER